MLFGTPSLLSFQFFKLFFILVLCRLIGVTSRIALYNEFLQNSSNGEHMYRASAAIILLLEVRKFKLKNKILLLTVGIHVQRIRCSIAELPTTTI